MCSVIRLIQRVTSQKIHPTEKGPWRTGMYQHEQRYNRNSNQDEEAIHDTLESLLVLNQVELY